MSNLKQLKEIYQESQKTLYEKYKDLSLEELDKFKFNHGKKEKLTFLEALEDTDYCSWMLKNQVSKRSLNYLFKHYIIRKIEEQQ